MAIVGGLLVVLNEGLDLGVDSDTILAFTALMLGYIFGESYIDGKRVSK